VAIHNFDAMREQFVTIDSIPDHRSDVEKQFTPLSTYNHGKPDIAYAERLAEEMINISGAWITLFIKEPKGDSQELEIWDEDADPIYRAGKKMKAYFKPEPVMTELTRWGVDTPLRITVVFSRASLMMDGSINERLVQPGDVIEAPYNLPTPYDTGPLMFRILNSKEDGFFQYRWLYVNAICELITGDDTLKVRVK
jgi:hypothetical protein